MLKEQLTIRLTPEQAEGWPVRTETLWFESLGGVVYKVRNIPLFIDGLAVDDIVTLKMAGAGEWEVKDVVTRSGNETIWILVRDESLGARVLDRLIKLGCQIDGGVLAEQFALNIGPDIEKKKIMGILESAERNKLLDLAFPMAD